MNGDAPKFERVSVTQKQQPKSPGLTSRRSPQPKSPNPLPNKPLPVAPDLMIPARQASRAKLAHEEKLRRRSLDLLREQEKAKATTQSERKASMTEKVRSVTKRGSTQAVLSKTKSPRPSDTRSSAPSKATPPPLRSPKFIWSDSAARPPAQRDVEERAPQSLPSGQPSGAVELPAEVPGDSTATQETPKKGGLHIHLGSKHRNKEHGSGPSSSKALNMFRRSHHSLPPPETTTESHPTEATTPPPKSATASPSAEETHRVEIRLSPPSVPPPRGPGPDPGLPTPPALVPKREPSSYTALPDILATAQRATAARASLRVSVPSSVDPEPEETPRVVPSQPSEAVHTQVTLTERPSDDSKTQTTPGNESKHTSYHSSLSEPGLEAPWLDAAQASEQQSATAQDGEKTPTTKVRPHVGIPTPPSTAAQDAMVEPVDTSLTSATMRSYSDFCKLPPQQTPPPITPEESVANRSIASSVASSAVHSKTASLQETEIVAEAGTKSEPSIAQAAEQVPSPRSPPGQRLSAEKKAANPKDLRLKPRNKDLQNQSELLDMIASTPPHSPIHRRASSDGSALNAVGMTSSTSRVLAPPEEAPPPPAPGGRSMMIPDYASAGAFEGERKPKRSSGMSTGGWKKMFAGGGNAPAASGPGNSIGMLGMPGPKAEEEEIHMGANLMSGGGNDVLWYKGMGRDGLWVSGA